MHLNDGAWRTFPASLFARMALILLGGLLAAQVASLWLQWGERATVVAQARGQNFADRLVEAIRVLESETPARRAAAAAMLESRDLTVTLIGDGQVAPNVPRGQIRASVAARLGSAREIRSSGGGAMMMDAPGTMSHRGSMSMLRSFDVRLRDGQWVRIAAARESEVPPALPSELIAQLLITLLIVIAVVMIAVRQATRPLQLLAQAADTLGGDLDAPPLAERGPTETRRATQAFNRMQARIKRLVDERSRALAAVSHDLRTPLTRLRLRTELVGDDSLREQMASDLDTMAAMIDATLDYLRGLQESETLRRIDMNALAQSLADDCAVLGKTIGVEGLALSPYNGRLSALRRALQNLIDNACKYAQGARLRIEDDAATLRLSVDDDGPGIPSEELARVGEPYYRPDSSRSHATGGLGLGLSIARDIALLHGGRLLLANRAGGGFSATLVLPRAPQR